MKLLSRNVLAPAGVTLSLSFVAAIFMGALCAFTVACGGGGNSVAPPPPPTPQITWSMSSIEPILSPGETGSIAVTFKSSVSLQNATLQASSSIAPYVTFSPSSFASVPANQNQSLTVTVTIPGETTLADLTGTIQLSSRAENYDQALGALLHIWNNYSGGSFSIKLPPGWRGQAVENARFSFLPPGSILDPSSEYVGDITADVVGNPSKVDLATFYQTVAVVNLFSNSQSNSVLPGSDFPAIKFVGVFGMLPTDTIAVNKGSNIIEISDNGQLHASDRLLDLMTSTLR